MTYETRAPSWFPIAPLFPCGEAAFFCFVLMGCPLAATTAVFFRVHEEELTERNPACTVGESFYSPLFALRNFGPMTDISLFAA